MKQIGHGDIPDEEVVFMDGRLYIICRDKEGNYSLGVEVINPEYEESYISLKDIAERYPDVTVVLHDSWLDGEVFSYGNYNKGEWVQYGSTRGFA